MIEEEQDNTIDMEAHPDYSESLDSLLTDLAKCYSVTFNNGTASSLDSSLSLATSFSASTSYFLSGTDTEHFAEIAMVLNELGEVSEQSVTVTDVDGEEICSNSEALECSEGTEFSMEYEVEVEADEHLQVMRFEDVFKGHV